MNFEAVRYEVSFWNGTAQLAGDLIIPAGPGPHPAAVLVGSNAGVRDRGGWVDELALSGLAVISWDSPGWGRSAGERGWRAPDQRTLEVLAAIDYLRTVPDISETGIAVLGVELGSWPAALAAGMSSAVQAVVMLSPPATGGIAAELDRLGQRLWELGFISAEIQLAQAVLHERARRLAAGDTAAAVFAAEAACRPAPWYGSLPGNTPEEIEAFSSLVSFSPRAVLASVHCPVLAVFGRDDPSGQGPERAEQLRRAWWTPDPRDRRISVLPRSRDERNRGTWSADDPAAPSTPNWHDELVGHVAEWLQPRIVRRAPVGVPAPSPVSAWLATGA